MSTDGVEIADDVQTPASMKTELLNLYRTGALTKLGLKVTESTIKKASEKNIEKCTMSIESCIIHK